MIIIIQKLKVAAYGKFLFFYEFYEALRLIKQKVAGKKM